MAKVVRFYETGGPEVLKLEHIEIAPPGPEEVTIQVKALGLNRAESAFRLGKYLESPQFPSRIGYEASGVVQAVGSSVKGIAPGDVVSVAPPSIIDRASTDKTSSLSKYGVYGEVATVPAYFVIKHPENLSFVEAAAVWMQYLTAYGALIDIAHLQKGDDVVITAASSSVGLAAIQLVNLIGASPIAVTRTHVKRQALIDAGAAHVIASEEEDVTEKIQEYTNHQGARIAFDPIGGKQVINLAKGMMRGGILFQYGGLSAEPTPFPLMLALAKGLTMRGYTLFELLSDPARFEKAKKFLIESLSSNKLKPIIVKTFPLEKIVEAHRYLESNAQIGKIIVTVP